MGRIKVKERIRIPLADKSRIVPHAGVYLLDSEEKYYVERLLPDNHVLLARGCLNKELLAVHVDECNLQYYHGWYSLKADNRCGGLSYLDAKGKPIRITAVSREFGWGGAEYNWDDKVYVGVVFECIRHTKTYGSNNYWCYDGHGF